MTSAAQQPVPSAWHDHWSWPQAAAIVIALVGGALVIQAGHPGLRAIPPAGWAGVLLVGSPLVILLLARVWAGNQVLVRGLGSIELALSSLGALILLATPAAIWPQGNAAPAWLLALGLGDLFTSLPYATTLGILLVNLATVCGDRLRHLTWSGMPLLLVHGGLLLALSAAAAGSGSFLRGRLILQEGAGAQRVIVDREDQPIAQLPRGIALEDFRMREAPPRLVLVDGRRLTLSRDHIFETTLITLGDLQIHIEQCLDEAAVIAGQPVPFVQPGARPAVLVRVVADTGELGRGWLHAPSLHGEALFLDLGAHRALLLEEPRPEHFVSAVHLAGETRTAPLLLEVNRPLRLGDWWCYQASYDEDAGPASQISILDCVYDPSYTWVRLGLIVFLFGLLGDLVLRRLGGAA